MYNKSVLIGRLTRDPELRYTQGEGVPVTNFTLAVDRPFTNQKGEKEADFIKIVVWKKTAENCATYLAKGSLVAVEGRLQIRSYEDKESVKRYVAEIVARNVVFLDSRNKNGNGNTDNADNASNSGVEDAFGGSDLGDEDVPF